MSAAFTPGPWSVTDNSWETSSVYGADGSVVAECPIDSDVCEESQDQYEPIKEANARLIGAAPELFEAVTLLLAPSDGHDNMTRQFAKQALAKARGEQ